jgi:hypothetical protein
MPIDPGELSLQVKQRMDELFPDAGPSAEGADAPGGGAAYTLAASRRIVKSLEPTSQTNRLRDYLNELIRLQGVFVRDTHLRGVVQAQITLCRYLLENPHRLERRALELLAEGFAALERLSAADPMPAEERERLVRGLTGALAAWRKPPKASHEAGARAAGTADKPVDTPAAPPAAATRRPVPGAYYLIPVEDIDELKRFFRREIAQLRREMSGRLQAK